MARACGGVKGSVAMEEEEEEEEEGRVKRLTTKSLCIVIKIDKHITYPGVNSILYIETSHNTSNRTTSFGFY